MTFSNNDDESEAFRQELREIPKFHWFLVFVGMLVHMPLLVALNVKSPWSLIFLFLFTGIAMATVIWRHRAKVEKETIERLMRDD